MILCGSLEQNDHQYLFAPFLFKFNPLTPQNNIWQNVSYGDFQSFNTFECVTSSGDSTLFTYGQYESKFDSVGTIVLMRLTKINSKTGKIIFDRHYDYSGDEHSSWAHCYGICATKDGGIIASIAKVNSGVNNPLFYVKYDSNGCDSTLAYCEVAYPVPELNELSAFTLYPHPAVGQITLHFARPLTQHLLLTLTDARGQLVFRTVAQAHSQQLDLDLSSFAPGVYSLSAESSGFRPQKLVITRD